MGPAYVLYGLCTLLPLLLYMLQQFLCSCQSTPDPTGVPLGRFWPITPTSRGCGSC